MNNEQRPIKVYEILIADDDPSILHSLYKFFSREGYRILLAQNANEAISIIKERRPDLLILDVKMPGKSAIELIEEIMSEGFNIPIIIMTAYSNIFTSSEAKAIGAKGYFQKPFDIENMNALVKKILTDG
jgi:two-component system response regulator (stage 0 sporulation protein F)